MHIPSNFHHKVVLNPRDLMSDTSTSKIVHKHRVEEQYIKVREEIQAYVENNHIYLTYEDGGFHVADVIFDHCSMVLNMLANRGRKNILFVGYHNGAILSWLTNFEGNYYEDFVHDAVADQHCFMDFNRCFQFLPIVAKAYEYEIEFTVVRPPRSKNLGIMHGLYDTWEIPHVDSYQQFEIDHTTIDLTGTEMRSYDTVVLAGVPRDSAKEMYVVKGLFGQYCTEDFELVDLEYSTIENYDELDITNDIIKMFSVAAESELMDDTIVPEDRISATKRQDIDLIMRKSFSVF